MLGEISPHHDYYDSKSSSETPPSYNQLNYNENIERFFQSKPKTTVSDESSERPSASNDTDPEGKIMSAVQDCANNQWASYDFIYRHPLIFLFSGNVFLQLETVERLVVEVQEILVLSVIPTWKVPLQVLLIRLTILTNLRIWRKRFCTSNNVGELIKRWFLM